MEYPTLENTPIKEIVFSISFDENTNNHSSAERFIQLDDINNKFDEINNIFGQTVKFDKEKTPLISKDQIGYDLKSKHEVLRLRNGRFSYHFLNNYQEFDEILTKFIYYWNLYNKNIAGELNITNCSVRYINLIEIDEDEQASRLVQLYPKYSSDRDILAFQNAVKFQYKESPESEINVVTSKIDDQNILLDITANHTISLKNLDNIKMHFAPLQQLKNKAFFDSITAKALLKYLKK